MGCNHNNIRDLLLKFWDGQTTLEEENDIKAFFQYNDVGEDLKDDKAYFELLREKEENILGDDFDALILDKINENPGGQVRLMNYRNLFRTAATVLIIVGVAALVRFMDKKDEKQLAEIQKQEEVQRAFEETKEALFLISSKLNKGGNHTMMLGKFNDAENTIKSESDPNKLK